MSGGTLWQSRSIRRGAVLLAVAAIAAGPVSHARGQIVRNAVGGVSISPDGVVRQPTQQEQDSLLSLLRKDWTPAPDELEGLVELRKVSLRGLNDALQALPDGDPARLPEEIRFLAGLQRIRYLFVYPELHDIVLAGPGEGWVLDDEGVAVGATTHRPVLLLEDLLVALQAVQHNRGAGISCSIDPTEQGYRALNSLLDRQRRARTNVDVRRLEAAMKKAFGPQQVKLTGVAGDTHLARVLVAADYRMKRLAMDLEPSPVAGLPSYLDLIKGGRAVTGNTNPRWWLACNYDPLAMSDDGLAWELRGPGVKAMTEDDFVSAEGKVRGAGRKNPNAQKWADLLTSRYDELSVERAVFGQLRNVMDLCVIAALIEDRQLLDRAGCRLPRLTGASNQFSLAAWHAPRTVAPECSFVRTRNGWLVTASGGVQIDAWSVAQRTEVRRDVAPLRTQAKRPASAPWRWN